MENYTSSINEQELFLNAFQHAPIGMALIDLEGRFIKVNRSFCDFLGYQAEELLSITFKAITYIEDLDVGLEGYYQLLRNACETFRVEKRYYHKSGKLVWGLLSVSVVCDETQKPLYLIAQIKDINKHKQGEHLLNESYAQYQQLADQMPEPMIVLRYEKIKYINQAALSLLGLNTLVGDERVLNYIHPHDHRKVIQHVKLLLESPLNLGTIDLRVRHEDGHYIEIEVAASRIRYVGQVCIQAVIRDITLHKNAERRSVELLRRTERLNALSELAAGIAHEIRNPLASVMGFVQLFQQDLVDHKYFPYFSLISVELSRINNIVSEFLLLSKTDTTKFNWVEFQPLLEQVIQLLTPQAHLHSIEIIKEIEIGIGMIQCNEVKIKQVLINLIKNAIEAMPNGGFITLKAKRKGTCVQVQVTDQGSGIPAVLLSQIMKPFFTTKEQGTGLGLMISKDIIEQHQGKIVFHSTENVGTTVEIRLPIHSSAHYQENQLLTQ